MTEDGGYAAAVSNDGRTIYLVRHDQAGIWRRPLDAPAAAPSEPWLADLAPTDWPAWAVVPAGVVYFHRDADGHAALRLRPHDAQPADADRLLVTLDGPRGALHEAWSDSSLLVSPDLHRVVVASLDRSESDLWILRQR